MIKGPCNLCGDVNYSLSCGGDEICPACDSGSNPYDRIRRLREENIQLRKMLLYLSEPNLRSFYDIHYGYNKDGCEPTIILDIPKHIYKSVCEAVILAKYDFYKSYQNGELVDEWVRQPDE